jgi:hypothetical protein
MKTFFLLELKFGANMVLNEIKRDNEGQAIEYYQKLYPELRLNDNGYAKSGHVSYCIARKFGE